MLIFRRKFIVMLSIATIAWTAISIGSAAASDTPRLSPVLAPLFPHGLPPGATMVGAGRVILAGGHIIIDAPSVGTDGVCTTGYVCLWRDAQYLNTRVMTNVCDFTGDGQCDWQNLILVSFNDVMSSWMNRMTVDAKWSFNAGGGGTQRCMNAGSQNPQLSAGNNDQASAVKIFMSSAAC